jgi:methyl coenzyme M reductase subunit C-like uncharacterized protein (methanogenesis marker protein 7)
LVITNSLPFVNKRRVLARQITPPDDSNATEVQRALAYVGLFSRVARKLKRSPSHVIEVAKGRRQSAIVISAIVDEVRQIEQRAA